ISSTSMRQDPASLSWSGVAQAIRRCRRFRVRQFPRSCRGPKYRPGRYPTGLSQPKITSEFRINEFVATEKSGGSSPTGVSRSYTSVHFQPVTRVTFGINYNYFWNLPTFDPRLVGTGLLD